MTKAKKKASAEVHRFETGAILCELFHKAGLSPNAVASRLKISTSYVHKLKSGEKPVTKSLAPHLSKLSHEHRDKVSKVYTARELLSPLHEFENKQVEALERHLINS